MRTREEQLEEMAATISDLASNGLCVSYELIKHWVDQAEERARTECAADTRRLEWLAASLIDMRIHSQQRTIHAHGPMTAFDFRQSIDIAQKGGK